jgi:hypothetical protein
VAEVERRRVDLPTAVLLNVRRFDPEPKLVENGDETRLFSRTVA